MVSLSDFHVGQTTYECDYDLLQKPIERKVVEVGRKHVTVDDGSKSRYCVDSSVQWANALLEQSEFGCARLLFISKEAVAEARHRLIVLQQTFESYMGIHSKEKE